MNLLGLYRLKPLRNVSSLMKPKRLLLHRSFSFSRAQSLGLPQIRVTNPFGVRLLKMSRSVLKAILIFYGTVAVVGGTTFSTINYYLNQNEKLPFLGTKSLSFEHLMFLKLGMFNELITKNYSWANEYYMVYLRLINKENGLKFDKQMGTLPEYPSNEDIYGKGKKWYELYTNFLIRTALVKSQLGKLEESKELLEKVRSFDGFLAEHGVTQSSGDKFLKSSGYRLLAKIYTDKQAIESNYITSIKILAGDNEECYLINKNTDMSRALYDTVKDLGEFYAKNGDLNKSFKIFMNNLFYLQKYQNQKPLFPSVSRLLNEFFENKDFSGFNTEPSDIPLMKYFIAEILWAKKSHQSAINWTKDALADAHNFSKQDKNCAIISKLCLDNLVKMYTKLNKNGQYDEKIKNCEEMGDNVYIPMNPVTGWSIFLGK